MPDRYRKKPVEIDAVQWDGTTEEATRIIEWALANHVTITYHCPDGDACRRDTHVLLVCTLEGAMSALPGEWIIRGVAGEFYPCRDDIFRATYEPVEATTDPEPTPAAAWSEPADWPIPGHAPGLYIVHSTGDGEGPAVITDDGRLLIKQDHPEYWSDLTDLYPFARWPLTPITALSEGGKA